MLTVFKITYETTGKWNVLICTHKRLHKQVANYEKDTRKDIALHVLIMVHIFTCIANAMFSWWYGPFYMNLQK